MPDREKTYLLKELTRTIDESDSTAAFCLCQRWILKDALALLKEKEDRHRLEVHNIGNVDIPEGVSKEHFHLVMNNVVEALQHTDKGESYPYEDTGR